MPLAAAIAAVNRAMIKPRAGRSAVGPICATATRHALSG
jgi:hypothetical protein